jgi:hypothetical protein
MSEIRTAKVVIIDSYKIWDGPNGTIYYCQCQMDNGDKIEIGKKAIPKEGWEMSYSIVDTSQEWNKVKSEVKPIQAPTQQRPQSNQTQDKVGDSILFQVCLKVASELLTEHSITLPEASSVVEYARELAKLSKEQITLM